MVALPSALSEMERMIKNGTSLIEATWAIAPPSISAQSMEGIDQPVFLFLTRDELVTSQNQTFVNGDIRVCLMAASDSQIVKLLIRCEYLSGAQHHPADSQGPSHQGHAELPQWKRRCRRC